MADKKITQLTELTTSDSSDLLMIVDDVNGTPLSKKITIKSFFGAIPSNTSISGILTTTGKININGSNTSISSNANFTAAKGPKISAGYVTLAAKKTVNSNNATTVLGAGGLQGSIFWDANYLYLATSNTAIKRVALSNF